jgi:hypothetical protein
VALRPPASVPRGEAKDGREREEREEREERGGWEEGDVCGGKIKIMDKAGGRGGGVKSVPGCPSSRY